MMGMFQTDPCRENNDGPQGHSGSPNTIPTQPRSSYNSSVNAPFRMSVWKRHPKYQFRAHSANLTSKTWYYVSAFYHVCTCTDNFIRCTNLQKLLGLFSREGNFTRINLGLKYQYSEHTAHVEKVESYPPRDECVSACVVHFPTCIPLRCT